MVKTLRKLPGLNRLFYTLDSLHDGTNRLTREISRLDRRIDNLETVTQMLSEGIIDATIGKHTGVTEGNNQPNLIVSLTTYPARIKRVGLAIYSLLRQTYKPDAVILWLAEEQFPNKIADLPRSLTELTKMGLKIKWCDDIRSFKKILPTLQNFPTSLVVTADDDIFYSPDWLERLIKAYKEKPDIVFAHRCHKIIFDQNGQMLPYHRWKQYSSDCLTPSPRNFPTSGAGVLYFPGCFHDDILDLEKIMCITPNSDDIWLWAMLALKGTPIRRLDMGYQDIVSTGTSHEDIDDSLYSKNVQSDGGILLKDAQLNKLLANYPDLMRVLQQE